MDLCMIERDLIIDYQMVKSRLPERVEERVKELIDSCNNWEPKGDPMKMKIDGFDVIVQCMAQYEKQGQQ